MLYEITQIKRILARRLGLKLEGKGFDTRVVGDVPDGEYRMRIGRSRSMSTVSVKNGFISIL